MINNLIKKEPNNLLKQEILVLVVPPANNCQITTPNQFRTWSGSNFTTVPTLSRSSKNTSTVSSTFSTITLINEKCRKIFIFNKKGQLRSCQYGRRPSSMPTLSSKSLSREARAYAQSRIRQFGGRSRFYPQINNKHSQ